MWNFRSQEPLPPALAKDEIDLANVIAAINENTDNVRQLEADVRITMNGLPAAISGTLLMENPSRLRLQAGIFRMTDLGVDIGSNEDVFWIWTKTSLPGQPSNIMYARHDQFMQSQAGKHIRIQPKWIVNAFGLIRFEQNDQHEGPYVRPDKRLTIRSQFMSDGEMMTRDVVVNPKYGWIEQVALYDSNNQRIAYANARDHQYNEQNRATIPRSVHLFVFPEGGESIELSIQVTRSKLNQLYVDPSKTWTMPQPADVQQIDMSRMSFDGQSPSASVVPIQDPPLESQNGDRTSTLVRERDYTVTR